MERGSAKLTAEDIRGFIPKEGEPEVYGLELNDKVYLVQRAPTVKEGYMLLELPSFEGVLKKK